MGKQRSPFRIPRPGAAIYSAIDKAVEELILRQPSYPLPDEKKIAGLAKEIRALYDLADRLAAAVRELDAPAEKDFIRGHTPTPDPGRVSAFNHYYSHLAAKEARASVALDKDPLGGTRSRDPDDDPTPEPDQPPRTKILNKHGDVIGYQNHDGNGGTIK